MLKGALQWSIYPQRIESIYRRKWLPLQISPYMLVLCLPTSEGWKAGWTLAGKKVSTISNDLLCKWNVFLGSWAHLFLDAGNNAKDFPKFSVLKRIFVFEKLVEIWRLFSRKYLLIAQINETDPAWNRHVWSSDIICPKKKEKTPKRNLNKQ